ncbi:hypothetical protein [Methanogenium cariaci]|uniref:hypothetical protein n=1 Tax=Methanogenium cariaci TaxID=2197 RepID=UPI001FE07D10|nr:hypothetical protein [Methanogenium cariaci]
MPKGSAIRAGFLSAEANKAKRYTVITMADITEIEVIGFSDGACGPFPCDDTRTCELSTCAPPRKSGEGM